MTSSSALRLRLARRDWRRRLEMEAMAADNESVDREKEWFTWAQSALGADEARCRSAARAAAAVQGTGAGFAAAAAAARAAYADDGVSRTNPLPWEAKAAPAGIEHGSTRLHSPDGQWIWNGQDWVVRSEEHTSELQSHVNL